MIRNDQCGCRYNIHGKRIRCELHPNKYIEPKRPTYHPMNPEQILAFGKGIEDELAQALYFFIYVSGGRISEVTDMTPNRIQKMPDMILIRIKTLKQRRGDNLRRLPIPIGKDAKCHEEEMIGYVFRYIAQFNSMDKPFRKWGSKSGMSVYLRRNIPPITLEARMKSITGEYIDKEITKPFHPHYLRHARATHLVDFYNFDGVQLCAFFGWKTQTIALRYVRYMDLWKAFTRS